MADPRTIDLAKPMKDWSEVDGDELLYINVPPIPESKTSAELIWFHAPEDEIKKGEAVFGLKIGEQIYQYSAPTDCTLAEIEYSQGLQVKEGYIIGAQRLPPMSVKDFRLPTGNDSEEILIVTKWIKNIGDAVSDGEAIIEVENDKASVEVTSDENGYLAECLYEAGDKVKVGSVIGRISTRKPQLVPPQKVIEPVAPAPAAPKPVFMPQRNVVNDDGLTDEDFD